MVSEVEASPPIACMLGAGDFKARLAEIEALNTRSLRSAKQHGLTLCLSYAKSARAQVEDLVRRERTCCAFLTFDMKVRLSDVLLTITSPPEAREASETLFEQFSARTSCEGSCACGAS